MNATTARVITTRALPTVITADPIAATATMTTQQVPLLATALGTILLVASTVIVLPSASTHATLTLMRSTQKVREGVHSLLNALCLGTSQEVEMEAEVDQRAKEGEDTLDLKTEINLNSRANHSDLIRITCEPGACSLPFQYVSSLYGAVSLPTSQEKGSQFLQAVLHSSSSSWSCQRGSCEWESPPPSRSRPLTTRLHPTIITVLPVQLSH